MDETLVIVETSEQFDRVLEYVADPQFEFASHDLETTGLEKDAEVIGVSVSVEESIGIYIVLAHWQVEVNHTSCPKCEGKGEIGKKKKKVCPTCEGLKQLEVKTGKLIRNAELHRRMPELINILATKKIIGANYGFDAERTDRAWGMDLMPYLHTDVQELWHLLDENNSCGLKEVGLRLWGGDALKEKEEMRQSVVRNGGIWEKKKGGIKEMYKADKDLIANYGAKDAILTLKNFYEGVVRLFDEGLDDFFYEQESMPLLKGPTYQMNTTGLKLDTDALALLEKELTADCARLRQEVQDAIAPHVKEKYPNGFGKKPGQFNIGASQQMAWLLYIKLGNEFGKLTDGGRVIAKDLCGRIPYNAAAKRHFIREVTAAGKNPAKYLKCNKDAYTNYVRKYDWCSKLLQYNAYGKLLKTYVKGMQKRVRYGILNPNFLQHGTTSGRYSSNNPNFQNLPRDDKRVKKCIVSRPGRVFVGADYSQLEPRVFASTSQDEKLMACFAKGEDFYSVVGIPVFKKFDASPYKKDPNAFAEKYPDLRQNAKTLALATPYGQSAFQQAEKLRDEEGNLISSNEAQGFIDAYFAAYPSVEAMMLESHELAKRDGKVVNLFGRPRRIPEAKRINKIYGKQSHGDLPYVARTLLNLAMNHRVQSTAASIVNRAAINFYVRMQVLGLDAKIVLQVHDEIIVECRVEDAEIVKRELKLAMETTVTLPGVALVAEPKIAYNLADLK